VRRALNWLHLPLFWVATYPVLAQVGGSGGTSNPPAPPPIANAMVSNSGYQGSVVEEQPLSTPIDLSLRDAIQRGLKYNLGLLNSVQSSQSVRAQRLRVLSGLLPNISGDYQQTVQQINLAAFGFKFNLPPGLGFSIPSIVGPFGTIDTRANLSQTIVDLSQYRNLKSADASVRASQLSLQDSKDLVVQAVGNAYLLIISDTSRVETEKATVDTSQALFQRASDQKAAGTVAGIDQLRAEVQLRTDQQSLLAAQNQLAKDRLALGRVIGLPLAQQFNLTDRLPFTPLSALTVEDALRAAYANRPDFKAAEEQLRAAELARRAATAEYYPTVGLSANYGDSGVNIGNSHGVFDVTGTLRFNIFDGGRIRSDIQEADVHVKERKDALNDLRGQIDFQIRSALLDLQSASDQVSVATRNVDLANQTLTQARDRFTAGVTDNIEVVQAQQSVVTANDNLISSTYTHNLAKIALARSLGLTEENLNRFLGGSK